MKKIVTLLLLGTAFFLGTQNSHAQDEFRKQAKEQVLKLDKMLQLSPDQEKKVYRAYVSNEINYGNLEENKENDKGWKASKHKVDASLWKVMEETLTPEQFKKYKNLRMENMSEDEIKAMKKMEKKNSLKARR